MFEALDKRRATKIGTKEVLTLMELLLVDAATVQVRMKRSNADVIDEP